MAMGKKMCADEIKEFVLSGVRYYSIGNNRKEIGLDLLFSVNLI